MFVTTICLNLLLQVLNFVGGDCNNKDGKRRTFSIQSPFLLYHLIIISPSLEKQQRNKLLTSWWCLDLLLHCALHYITIRGQLRGDTRMGTKMKGIYKGFKHSLSQIFVVKDREIEIGYPTDVKHVAHIGWDGPSGSAPSWMNEFRTGPDFAATSIGNSGSSPSPWSSQDYGQSMRQTSEASTMFKDMSTETPTAKKKHRRKNKSKSASSPKSVSGSTSRASRAAKSKSKFVNEDKSKPTNIEVV